MKHTLLTIASTIVFAATAFAGDFDLYLQVEQAKRDCATNETAQAFLDNLTDDQWLQFADEYIATNSILHQADGKSHGVVGYNLCTSTGAWWLGWRIASIGARRGNAMALCDVYDQKFVDAGMTCWFPYDDRCAYFPKGHAYYMESINTNASVKAKYSAILVCQFARRDTVSVDGRARSLFTAPEYINWLANVMTIGMRSIKANSGGVKQAAARATKPIKRKLRERGISFVVKEGEANPVQEAIDALTAAFNAPKLAGVKEWVAEWFPEYHWIDIDNLFMSDEEMAQLCDDIYYGEKDMTDSYAQRILAHIGLEAYNAFIERYNGK